MENLKSFVNLYRMDLCLILTVSATKSRNGYFNTRKQDPGWEVEIH